MPINPTRSKQLIDKTKFTSSSFWKPKGGNDDFEDNYVRVLENPFLEGDLFLPVCLHWPPEGANWNAFLCPRNMFQKNCPVCEAGFAELRRLKVQLPDKEARAACRHYWPTWAYYFTVVPVERDGTPTVETPQILSANQDLVGLLSDEMWDTDGCPGCDGDGDHLPNCTEPDDANRRALDYTDLKSGFTLNIRTRKRVDGGYTKHDYAIKKPKKPTAFDHPQLIEQIPDPRSLNTMMDFEEIQGLLSQEGQLLLGTGNNGADSDPLAPETQEAPEVEESDDSRDDSTPDWGDEDDTTPEPPKAESPKEEEAKPKRRKASSKKTESAEDVAERKARLQEQLQTTATDK